MNMETENSTHFSSDIDDRYQAVAGFLCFFTNFCILFHWRALCRDRIFPILLNLCAANALKSSVHYISGLQALFLHYYYHTTYQGSLDPSRSWTHIWTFLSHQYVCWSTLALSFDRFVAAAYPDQYCHTHIIYQLCVVIGSWIVTIATWLAAFIFSKRFPLDIWYELTIVRPDSPAIVGFFRCLNTAGSISCFIFLLSTIVVYARRVNESRESKRKKKWTNTLNVGPPRKKAVTRIPSRPLLLVNQISIEKIEKSKPWAFDLVPALLSWYFNAILWLLPALVLFIRTASSDTLTFQSSTISILALLQSFHGSVDILVHTFKIRSKERKFFCCDGSPRSRTSSSASLMRGTSTTSYQACSSNAGNTSYFNLEDHTIIEEASVLCE